MNTLLRVLHIEDDAADALLVQRVLVRAGMGIEPLRVETRAQLEVALAEPWDLIIADYSLPAFGAEEALALVQSEGLDIPFIIVSGTIDEESAVSSLRAGAHDFITKARLARLVPAVERAIREREVRAAARAADELSRDSLAQNIPDLIARFDRDLRFTYVNPSVAATAGMLPAEFIGYSIDELDFAPEPARVWTETINQVFASGESAAVEFGYPSPSGYRWFHSRVVPEKRDGAIESVLSITREISEQKQTAEELRVRAEQQASVAQLGQRALAGLAPQRLLEDAVRMVHEVLGKGTGLGLATVHGIVTQANGHIDITSRRGGGTSFRIYLPSAEPAEAELVETVPAPRLSGEGTILLVEDDEGVRSICRRCLERGGYHVIEAATPGEALARIAEPHDRIDLLLSDVILPEMHGPLLAQQVRELLPNLPVLLMSGYLPTDLMDRVESGLITAETAIVAKPFTADGLLTKVRDVLHASALAAVL
jgi:PAS domain S-box-containing protein